jgi:pimeloyl-ACP methyl ester carboxylesterase
MSDSLASSLSEFSNRNLEQLDMPFFTANGITFHYADDNVDRLPFVFQHGLGADISQPMSFFGEDRPFRLISMDCRGHGKTVPLGDPKFLRFNSLTDDITNLLDYLNLSKVVIGGISMGAGVALNFAVRYPDRTRALILSRASWLAEPSPPNLAVFPKIAGLIREHASIEPKSCSRPPLNIKLPYNLRPRTLHRGCCNFFGSGLAKHSKYSNPYPTMFRLLILPPGKKWIFQPWF